MEKERLGQEPAYPLPNGIEIYYDGGEVSVSPENGMTKRFYAACTAMQGLISNPDLASQIYNQFGEVKSADVYKITCKTAYLIADELLKQEKL